MLVELGAVTTGVLVPAAFRDRQRLLHEFFEPDPMLGFRAKANLRNFEIRWSEAGERAAYSTDAQGFRNVGRNAGEARILFLGDSFAWGVWLERKLTFPDLLERRLGMPIANWGRQSYGIEQYALLAERFLDAYDPQIVAVCIYANDLGQPISRNSWRTFTALSAGANFGATPCCDERFCTRHGHGLRARIERGTRRRRIWTSLKPRTGCGSTGGWERTLIMNPQGTTRPSRPGTRTC